MYTVQPYNGALPTRFSRDERDIGASSTSAISPPALHEDLLLAVTDQTRSAVIMADSTSPAEASDEDFQLTFNVKSNDAKHVITIAASATVLELKTTLSTSEYADLPPERQRLIYSGRVLKDTETLDNYKIKKGHTVHLVKGAASNLQSSSTTAAANLPSSSSTTTGRAPAAGASAVPTNIATGTANNPLAGLTGARYAGFHNLPGIEMFGPDGGVSR